MQLINAVRLQSQSLVRSLLRTSSLSQLDWCAADGLNALHAAVLERNSSLCVALIEAGSDPNCVTHDRSALSPLHLAIDDDRSLSSARRALIAILLRCGADPCQRDAQNRSCLVLALRASDALAVVTLLLDYGAPVNAICNDAGQTPLHVAALRSDARACRLLLDRGAQLVVDRNGVSPLDIAARNHCNSIVAQLLEQHTTLSLANAIRFARNNCEMQRMLRAERLRRRRSRQNATIQLL